MKIAVMIAASLLALPIAAHAQAGWNPSADDLVRLLKPRASGPTRGIRALSTQEATPATTPITARSTTTMRHVPAATTASPALAAGDLASVPLHVEFPSGSDQLTPTAMRSLNALGKALANPALAEYKFRIEGHTDSVGSHDLNEALSARRATAVSDFIATHYGVDRARMTTVGLGDSQKLVPTAEGVAEPRNRRVQIVNVGN